MLGHEFYLVSNMNYLLFLNHKKSNENHVIFRCLDSFGQVHSCLGFAGTVTTQEVTECGGGATQISEYSSLIVRRVGISCCSVWNSKQLQLH